MADFYVNYGSSGAVLIGSLSYGSLKVSMHQIGDKYIISKNRKIQKIFHNEPYSALNSFRNIIDFELSDYLPFNS